MMVEGVGNEERVGAFIVFYNLVGGGMHDGRERGGMLCREGGASAFVAEWLVSWTCVQKDDGSVHGRVWW